MVPGIAAGKVSEILHLHPSTLTGVLKRLEETPKGPRLILALAPCPTGWNYDPKDSVEIGRLAVKTGNWPLKEYVALLKAKSIIIGSVPL